MKKIRDVIKRSTPTEPFAELDSLCDRLIEQTDTDTYKSYKLTIRFFKQYLAETNNYLLDYNSNVPFEFEQHVHVYTVANFRDYLIDNFLDQKSLKTLYRYVWFVQRVLLYAFEHRLTSVKVHKVPVFLNNRITDAYAPYTKEEMAAILEAIQKELQYFNSLKITSDDYVKTGVGRDPRERPRTTHERANRRALGYGWTLDNTINYFENMMDASPLRFIGENVKKHSSFFQLGLTSYPGGLDKFYEDRGLLPYIGRNIIGLYVLKLVFETGLNPEAVLTLKVDCFRKTHQMTGKPYLRYYKLRSKGEKDYTFFADEDATSSDFYMGIGQSVVVEATILKVLELTSYIRDAALQEDRDYLFLFQSIGANSFGNVLRFDRQKSSVYCNYLVTKYNLVDDKKQRLRLWLVRFRPTFIFEMVKNGRNVFEILAMVGHKNIRTTLNYLYLRSLEKDFQFDIDNALKTIHANRLALDQKNTDATQTETMYKGIIADCLDIFNPPEPVKNSKGYDVRIPCNRVHLCLSCPNVVIAKRHLPILYKYYTDIITSSPYRLGNLVHQIFYERTVSIIESIFNGHSDFTQKELEEAKAVSLQLPLLFIDSLVSSGYAASEEI